MTHVQTQLGVSERRACGVMEQPRSSQRYRARPPRDGERELVGRMLELVRTHPRYGYRFVWSLRRGEGFKINRKRAYRLWRQNGLRVPAKRHKTRRLGSSGNGIVRHRATRRDHVWAWDFVHDRTEDGRPLKWLSTVDEYTRECLALEVGRSFKSRDVIDVLEELIVIRGAPAHVRSDNGPEFIAKAIVGWMRDAKVATLYIAPGSPWENGYAESFHSKLRDEFLAREEFETLTAARKQTTTWKEDYNHHRPHSSLGYVTPAEFAARCAASATELLPAAPPATPPLQPHNGLTQPILS